MNIHTISSYHSLHTPSYSLVPTTQHTHAHTHTIHAHSNRNTVPICSYPMAIADNAITHAQIPNEKVDISSFFPSIVKVYRTGVAPNFAMPVRIYDGVGMYVYRYLYVLWWYAMVYSLCCYVYSIHSGK